jgi:hypothetical protein
MDLAAALRDGRTDEDSVGGPRRLLVKFCLLLLLLGACAGAAAWYVFPDYREPTVAWIGQTWETGRRKLASIEWSSWTGGGANKDASPKAVARVPGPDKRLATRTSSPPKAEPAPPERMADRASAPVQQNQQNAAATLLPAPAPATAPAVQPKPATAPAQPAASPLKPSSAIASAPASQPDEITSIVVAESSSSPPTTAPATPPHAPSQTPVQTAAQTQSRPPQQSPDVSNAIRKSRELWRQALDAEAKEDFRTAVRYYEQIKQLPPAAWPGALQLYLDQAKKRLESSAQAD